VSFPATINGSRPTRKTLVRSKVLLRDKHSFARIFALIWEDRGDLPLVLGDDVFGEEIVVLSRQHLELHLKVSYKESMNEGKGQTSPPDVPNPEEGFWD